MFRLSPLRLRVFRTCRLRYAYQYVQPIAARLRPQDTAGTLVHNVLCDFFVKVPVQERTPERLIAMFQTRWDALSPRFLRLPGVDQLRQSAIDQLQRFAQQHDLWAEPFMTEAFFQVHLGPDLLLRGRLDRIDEESDGSLHIIDYKTGAHPEEVDPSQLHLYAIMVEEKLERPVSRASFWYLDDGSTWTIDLTPAGKEAARAAALAAVQDMLAETEFAPTIGPHCARCPYLYACRYRDQIAQQRQAEGW